MAEKRYNVDCRQSPKAEGCTLQMSGTEDEIMGTMVPHAVQRHGMQDSDETREQIRSMLRPVH